ncbi:hypothetical protein G7076_07070 [Sphingomonas sp. HDW15A]|uniref:hypothetical protein n=1 Tax=Sphingomonas sp. HDW15A TaxID=2714942 RepID=UPI001408C6E0|nr:hypothetical protein [Sphingomonas sp. HDW15A]QIK96240.1 hypothetical protein G7076_07070 [Sphingomonas sp. HDW15A]
MMGFTSDQWVIVTLVFVLGLLIGGFLFSGGGRKWKHRYKAEVARREDLERVHSEREAHWTDQEKEWRERDSLRGAALKDREGDGVRDNGDPVIDRDRDGIDDRREI